MRPHRNVSAVFHSSKFTKCRTRHRRSNATALPPPHYRLCLIDAVEDAVSTRRRMMMMITCHTFCLHSHTLVYRESLCKDLSQTPAEECLCVSHLLVFFSSLVSLRRFSLCSVLFSPSSVYTLSPLLTPYNLISASPCPHSPAFHFGSPPVFLAPKRHQNRKWGTIFSASSFL